MLAKLIVHAPDRPRAIIKMLKALSAYKIEGIKTNIPFVIDLLRHPEVVAGRTETGLIGKSFQGWTPTSFEREDPFSPFNVGAPFMAPGRDESRPYMRKKNTHQQGNQNLTAPMPGQVVKVLVVDGQAVKAGDVLIVMEAMKMEHSITAHKDTTVKKVFFKQGDKINMGDRLVELV